MVSTTPKAFTQEEFEDVSSYVSKLDITALADQMSVGESKCISNARGDGEGPVYVIVKGGGDIAMSSDSLAVRHTGSFGAGDVYVGTCFAVLCKAAGVEVDRNVKSVEALSSDQVTALACKQAYKVFLVAYGKNDPRNHVELVPSSTVNAKMFVAPVTACSSSNRTVVCTTMQHFFNKSNEWATHQFYAEQESGSASQVGREAFTGGQRTEGFGSASQTNRGAPQHVPAPASIVGESVNGGDSNVSAGVSRSKKRSIAPRASALGGPVSKNYRASNALMFNNADEIYQDKISRAYAQEIIEELFEVWGVPLDQPEAAKYAEDLLWTFIIAVTASNKADYNVKFDIPVKPVQRNGESTSTVEADFAKFSLLLAAKYGVTRRQFARGVADDLRNFLKHEDNQELLPDLATRIGCEVMLAYLAFDGSTHCTNMTTREVTFTKTLESRNLFERDDVIAQGASDKLMQGMSGGVRSVAPR